MQELQIFKNDEFGEIRTVDIDGEPWLVGKDVAEALGYSNTADAVQKHVDEEDKLTSRIAMSGQNRNIIAINESGLYSLVLSSKLPSAKRFKRWVTSEVLPSVRKHGLYAVDELLDDPDLMIKAMETLKAERKKIKALEEQAEQDRPKVLFADAVSSSHTSILIGELAKLLRQNGIDMGQNRLFDWLRDNGYLVRRKGTDYNMPTQKSMELGVFEIKETVVVHSDGHTDTKRTPKVTGKGQIYFINKLIREGSG